MEIRELKKQHVVKKEGMFMPDILMMAGGYAFYLGARELNNQIKESKFSIPQLHNTLINYQKIHLSKKNILTLALSIDDIKY